jgi:ABC-type dipeptide/oligopeptide/nickel transport system ATPase component
LTFPLVAILAREPPDSVLASRGISERAMLSELWIRNFAIIDELHLQLKPGLVVLTGETGAGKSIIVDAIELLLGGRGEGAMIRTSQEAAVIEAAFEIPASVRNELRAVLEREALWEGEAGVTLGREQLLGTVIGLADSGGLLLRTAEGEREVTAGEVTLLDMSTEGST